MVERPLCAIIPSWIAVIDQVRDVRRRHLGNEHDGLTGPMGSQIVAHRHMQRRHDPAVIDLIDPLDGPQLLGAKQTFLLEVAATLWRLACRWSCPSRDSIQLESHRSCARLLWSRRWLWTAQRE